MAEKKEKRHLGKLPPQYRVFFNPYKYERLTRCPQCRQPTKLRKFPLVIHIDPMNLFTVNKKCRYCPNCDLLIVHKHEIEYYVTEVFGKIRPETIGNRHLVVGTLERDVWKRGMKDPLMTDEVLAALHDFKEAVVFQLVGGWDFGPADQKRDT